MDFQLPCRRFVEWACCRQLTITTTRQTTAVDRRAATTAAAVVLFSIEGTGSRTTAASHRHHRSSLSHGGERWLLPMRQAKLLLFLLLLHLFPSLSGALLPPFSLRNGDVVYVADSFRSRPLCAESFTPALGQLICQQLEKGEYESSDIVSISDRSALNVNCYHSHCRTSVIFACNQGISITCRTNNYGNRCNGDGFSFANQCYHFNAKFVDDATTASSLCENRKGKLVSVKSDEENRFILGVINEYFSADGQWYTSGVRRGRQWSWGDQSTLNGSFSGEGRCLLISDGIGWSAGSCDQRAFYICQAPIAVDCVSDDEPYSGTQNRSRSGAPCMRWNHPAVLERGLVEFGQTDWNHNYCRDPKGRGRPWCLTSPNHYESCAIAKCHPGRSKMNEVRCAHDELRCGESSTQCVSRDFFCDYERDCENGFDEANCTDWLQQFTQRGNYKLVDEIAEIWTHIPHLQGCARRCLETNFRCESFSYDNSKKSCLLSRRLMSRPSLFPSLSSVFYQRQDQSLSSELMFRLTRQIVEVRKGGRWAPVCDEDLIDPSLLCEQFGYGYSLD